MAVSTIKHNAPKMEYVGGANQIHWSQWECPADGIIVFDFSLQTGGGAWYYYLRDVTLNIFAGKASGTSANGTSRTMTFPVLKGHIYKLDAQSGISGTGLIFHYYKFV